MSVYTFIMLFISMIYKSYFIVFRYSFYSMLFAIERDEILFLDLLKEYTLSFRLYFAVDAVLVVDVELYPLSIAIESFIF